MRQCDRVLIIAQQNVAPPGGAGVVGRYIVRPRAGTTSTIARSFRARAFPSRLQSARGGPVQQALSLQGPQPTRLRLYISCLSWKEPMATTLGCLTWRVDLESVLVHFRPLILEGQVKALSSL